MAVSIKATIMTKRKVAVTGMESKDFLKRVTSHTEAESQVAASCIREELEHNYSELFRNVAACRALLHNQVERVYRTLPNTYSGVVYFKAKVAVVESIHTDSAIPEQVSEEGADTDSPGDQQKGGLEQ